MALVLKINDVDKTSSVNWPDLQKSEGLTKEPDFLTFHTKKTTGKTIPVLNEDITFFEDAIKIFGGIVVEKKEVIIGGLLIGYNISCKDYSHLLDRKLVVKSYENQSAGDIVKDIIDTFTSGFTYVNIPSSTPTIGSIKFNYEPVTKAIQKISDLLGWDWYVDYDKDIHFFDDQTNTAPFNLDDTGGEFEWGSLEIERNILELKNVIIIRGGEYQSTITEANAVDKKDADGVQRVFNLIYKYSNINVKVNGVVQTVGVDNITDPATVDCLYNYQKRAIKFPDDSKPAAGEDVVIYGDAHIPLIATVDDNISVSAYGEYQHVIIDKSITTISEAHAIGKSELRKWSNGAYEARFTTKQKGLRTGQQIKVQSTIRGIDKTFKISRIVGRTVSSKTMEYEVYLLASGEFNFTDLMVSLIGRDKKNIEITDDEVLQRLKTFPEIIEVVDTLTATKNSPPYTWGPGGGNDFRWGFFTWS